MLRLLKLTNFRCFEEYEVEFERFNVLVGRNSMGKSTIVDALKLVSNVLRFARYRKGYLEDRDIPFPLTNLRHNYKEKETRVFAGFDDDTEIEVIFPVDGSPVANLIKAGAAMNRKDMTYLRNAVGMIPPVGTFEETERVGELNYVRSVMISHLTPRNFRNIWTFFPEGFDEFSKLVEKTWSECVILKPEPHLTENRIDMFFKENGATREIFWAGHGFQIWLQLMTFIVKLGHVETLVLDEPDIYLHSDMQKKLVAVCKTHANQVIIATHAVDIIEEVEPEEVVSIDRTLKRGVRVRDIGELQRSISLLGSQQNLRLTRLLRNRTILFVEGDDFRYLRGLARKLGYDSFAQESGFSVAQLEGFQNWRRLRYVNWTLDNVIGEKIKVFVILDRDYYVANEIDGTVSALTEKGVGVHVWSRKEIENYLIDFNVLYRIVTMKAADRRVTFNLDKMTFETKLASLLEDLKEETLSQILARALADPVNKGQDHSTVLKRTSADFNRNWKCLDFRIAVVSGKEFFAGLNNWLGSEFHLSVSVSQAVRAIQAAEISSEIPDVFREFLKFAGREPQSHQERLFQNGE